MFRRVYKILGKSDTDVTKITFETDTDEGREYLDSGKLSTEKYEGLGIIIEEYENDILLRSYEYLDPTRSTEHDVGLGAQFKIRVYIFTRNEHGELNNNETPAHVHIYATDGKTKICKVNITGECPRNNESMGKCAFDIVYKKSFDGILEKIVDWANFVRTTHKGKIKNWDYAKIWWKENITAVNR
jgi:hypothetical protein